MNADSENSELFFHNKIPFLRLILLIKISRALKINRPSRMNDGRKSHAY